jgi:hypothetical protein
VLDDDADEPFEEDGDPAEEAEAAAAESDAE